MNVSISISYEHVANWKELSVKDQLLIEKAFEAGENAYAPYSNFKVGASVQLENDVIITGNNQENIAYPSGLCAERVALFNAGANYPNVKIETLCVIAKGDLITKEKILSPCGSCRQVMVESEVRQQSPYRVILVSQTNEAIIFNSALNLLPLAFGIE